ncbi:MAG: hypothetical protein HY777_06920 [Betaproteobacteria bacterium]|nr:hypothetical protein [Betaproteobacteria bacterium]
MTATRLGKRRFERWSACGAGDRRADLYVEPPKLIAEVLSDSAAGRVTDGCSTTIPAKRLAALSRSG